jgi:hypothetical protein
LDRIHGKIEGCNFKEVAFILFTNGFNNEVQQQVMKQLDPGKTFFYFYFYFYFFFNKIQSYQFKDRYNKL